MHKANVCLAIVVSVLLSLIAFPALAQDTTTQMWVSHTRLAHVGRSSTGTDAIVGMVHVRDANHQRVAGASVTVLWTLPNGTVFYETQTTSVQGIARFSTWAGPGNYYLHVISITKAGWIYDATLNWEAVDVISVR